MLFSITATSKNCAYPQTVTLCQNRQRIDEPGHTLRRLSWRWLLRIRKPGRGQESGTGAMLMTGLRHARLRRPGQQLFYLTVTVGTFRNLHQSPIIELDAVINKRCFAFCTGCVQAHATFFTSAGRLLHLLRNWVEDTCRYLIVKYPKVRQILSLIRIVLHNGPLALVILAVRSNET